MEGVSAEQLSSQEREHQGDQWEPLAVTFRLTVGFDLVPAWGSGVRVCMDIGKYDVQYSFCFAGWRKNAPVTMAGMANRIR